MDDADDEIVEPAYRIEKSSMLTAYSLFFITCILTLFRLARCRPFTGRRSTPIDRRGPPIAACALIAVLGGSGCKDNPAQIISSLQQLPNNATRVTEASVSDCAHGGSLIEVFRDLNSNGLLDSGEVIISSQRICNGADGSQGKGAGVEVTQASSSSCPAGGTILKTFVDVNNNGVRDTEEPLTSVSTLCNGVAGIDGKSSQLNVVAASVSQCASGGFVYTSSTSGETPQVTIVCNGQNGQNAHYSMGAVGDAVAGQPFSACHHDYLYLPSPDGGSRGWLMFRHQTNGAADQGIGTTGFDTWNIDIADFLLVSEDRGTIYCSLHWDSSNRVLSYSVSSGNDGMAGRTGTLSF